MAVVIAMATDHSRVLIVAAVPCVVASTMDVVQNEWQDKEYECFNDPMNMLMGWCCPLCMMCDSAKRLEESVALYCLLSYFCAPCTLCMLRKTTREKYGIEV